MDSKVKATKGIIKKRKKIKEFAVLMRHTDKDWFFWINMALLDICRYKKQGNPWMLSISMERNMFVAEKFFFKKQRWVWQISTSFNIDGGTCWYAPPTCQLLKLQHHTSIFCLWEKHHYWKDYAIYKR
jgi:hypothetical protein